MKGTILKCMEQLVTEHFGQDKWAQALDQAGIPASRRRFTLLSDVNETDARAIMQAAAAVTSMSMSQFMDAFGEYWSTVFAPHVYAAYYSNVRSARELLLNLDHIHEVMTKSVKFAKPPRFVYEWQGDKHLIMRYRSGRDMIGLMPGLIRGVGKYYNEKLYVRVTGDAVHIEFP